MTCRSCSSPRAAGGAARSATPLQFLKVDGSYVVIGSFAGEDRHPSWWLNLQATPEAQVASRGRRQRVRAREALGEEREHLWQRIVEADAGYAETRAALPGASRSSSSSR